MNRSKKSISKRRNHSRKNFKHGRILNKLHDIIKQIIHKKTAVATLLRIVELLIPAVLLSIGFSLCLQYGIIREPFNENDRDLLYYHLLSVVAAMYFIFNFIMMRLSFKSFTKAKRSSKKKDSNDQDKDVRTPLVKSDLKRYYLSNLTALLIFAVFPITARYAFDQDLYRWIFGITNCFKLSATGISFHRFSSVHPIFSILLFITILLFTVPMAQIGVRAALIRSISNKRAARKERLATAEQSSIEYRKKQTEDKTLNIYDLALYDELAEEMSPEHAAKRRKFEEASRQLRARASKEALDIYAIAGQSMRADTDDERDSQQLEAEERSRKLREEGAKQGCVDIYAMAAKNDSHDDISDEQREKEELSRRLREEGANDLSHVDILNNTAAEDDNEKREAEERSRRLREEGAKQSGVDIYAMAAKNDSRDDISDEQREKEELSRRLREEGAKGPSRVDIYSGVRERDKKRKELEEEQG